jgi:hypothetical protein
LRAAGQVSLPKDAVLVELRPELLTFETRQVLLPATVVSMRLLMEGHAMPLQLPVVECLVVEKDRVGYIYQLRFSLESLPGPDRDLIRLFIAKGRGSPELTAP